MSGLSILCSSTVSGTVEPMFNSTPGRSMEATGFDLTYSRMTVSCSGAITTVWAAATLALARRRMPAAKAVTCVFIFNSFPVLADPHDPHTPVQRALWGAVPSAPPRGTSAAKSRQKSRGTRTLVHGVAAMVCRARSRGNAGDAGGVDQAKCGIIAMDRSVYQARWLLAPVFALSLSVAVLAALSG
jgi:hypothetical protein